MNLFELILVLGLLSATVPMSVDMYLPALPTLAEQFHATALEVQLTLAAFFVGMAVGQIVLGPFVDRFGRKPPIYWGLALFAIASIGCATSHSIIAMAGWRFLQAVGSCGGAVSSRAIVRDKFEPSEAARIFSLLYLVNGMAPILAPLIGGYFVVYAGWQAIFWFFALVGVLGIGMVVWRLRETRAGDPRVSLSVAPVFRTYWLLLRHRQFVVESGAGGISTAGMFAYIAGSPFVFIGVYHVPTQLYGWMFGINSLGIMIVTQLNAFLVKRWTPHDLQNWMMRVQAASGVAIFVDALTGFGGLYGLAVPLWFYVACVGGVNANAAALAMTAHGQRAGSASALLGTMQFVIAAATASLVGALHVSSALPMAALIAISGISCAALRQFAAKES